MIDENIQAIKIEMTEEEAILLWPKINEWRERTGEHPIFNRLTPKNEEWQKLYYF